MTMMMTNSLFGLEDMEALLWEPSFPMADAVGSVAVHPDQEDHRKGGRTSTDGAAAPMSPFNSSFVSSSSSPPPFYSPPHSPQTVLLGKTGISSDPFPFLARSGQLRDTELVSADGKDDMFGTLDWMAERVDLGDLDLDSLIGDCSPNEESSRDPNDILASLDFPDELNSLPITTLSSLAPPSDIPQSPFGSDPDVSAEPTSSHNDACDVPSPFIPEPQEELEIKSEPTSDLPSPCSPCDDTPASSPTYTLDLGSEVDVPMDEVKPEATVVPQVQRIVLSLSPTRIVLVLAPKDGSGVTASTRSNVSHSSSPAKSSRARPYPDPKQKETPLSPTVKVKSSPGMNERETLKAPKNRKLKKMEQNKTAATRYRQKKRAEQDALLTEHSMLERKNVELQEKSESMAREIEYLKELMEEVRVARLKSGL
ncbi:activating transcription factor 4b [Corythoichthys intestinalis]|uniref:activating transcription factor 4b n=1 Tax=Corythoichthys intestinalis TaxID=161448 RepID=UPI0025A67BD0|nr:activating transcription factor 4b [Corythoichthys intestinalis]XP_061805455.1 cyclic AMP-dependent transcription factor ATF-4-like [Nerophis lumbriciformis]